MEKIVYPGGQFSKIDKQEALRLLAKSYAMVSGWWAAFKECDKVDRILWDRFQQHQGIARQYRDDDGWAGRGIEGDKFAGFGIDEGEAGSSGAPCPA